ncbi:unnamed protein product [Linum trigynum]|uniref:Uncharacterized protein n=1 Tax=Linum trigynum TaxID=586398 RepID=A0AAV2GBJ9_9ROSI
MGKKCRSYVASKVFAKALQLSQTHDSDADAHLYEEMIKDAVADCLANTTIVIKYENDVAVALSLRTYMEEEKKRVNKEEK